MKKISRYLQSLSVQAREGFVLNTLALAAYLHKRHYHVLIGLETSLSTKSQKLKIVLRVLPEI